MGGSGADAAADAPQASASAADGAEGAGMLKPSRTRRPTRKALETRGRTTWPRPGREKELCAVTRSSVRLLPGPPIRMASWEAAPECGPFVQQMRCSSSEPSRREPGRAEDSVGVGVGWVRWQSGQEWRCGALMIGWGLGGIWVVLTTHLGDACKCSRRAPP